MNAIVEINECHPSPADQTIVPGLCETLIRERRDAIAMKDGIVLWHYVPDLLWEKIGGHMDRDTATAVRAACRERIGIVLRDKLPDWLILGASHIRTQPMVGSLFFMIVYDTAWEDHTLTWLSECFLPRIAPLLIEELLDCATGVLAGSAYGRSSGPTARV